MCSYFTLKYDLLGCKVVGLGGLEEIRFRDPVRPGDRLVVACQQLRVRRGAMIVCRFQAFVRGAIVAEGKIKGIPLPTDALVASQTTRERVRVPFMPRRSLRKIDAELDLAGHLLSSEQFAGGWHPAGLFGRSGPVEIEVGSGKGLFLTAAAAANPAVDYLGIEIARKYARYCAARLAKRGLPNARMLCADAQQFFHEHLPAGCIHAVHVYFPDPWWKARHKKRRVMNEHFAAAIERRADRRGKTPFLDRRGGVFRNHAGPIGRAYPAQRADERRRARGHA